MTKLTEIIPDDIPEWATKAMAEGQLFNITFERIKELERRLAAERSDGTLAKKEAVIKHWKRKNAALQAKIDALMLEYCPNDMTREQLDEYTKNQVPCEKPVG